jgi:GNAT superfamily N-acetyltransferase
VRLRPATPADLPRIYEVRHGTAENRLEDPSLVTDDEVAWYMEQAIFLVAEDDGGAVQGFVCANHQTAYIWALFVIDGQHGKGFGKALLDASLSRLAAAGHAQAFLTTGAKTSAADFYRRLGWRETGVSLRGELVFVKRLV